MRLLQLPVDRPARAVGPRPRAASRLGWLGAEHLAVDDDEGARAALATLLDELERHTRVEEAALFPALATWGAVGTADELERDHRRIDQVAVATEAHDDAGRRAIGELLDLLGTHIHREEYDVFPAALQLLPAFAWGEVQADAAAAT